MTNIILNQRHPGGVMKQMADAVGGITYDQYAPGGCVGQLYAATGTEIPLDQYAAGGVAAVLESAAEAATVYPEPEEPETPEWVPENAYIHIDLIRAFNAQDAAWVRGTGVVAVDTQLGADPNTENAWDVTEYDPESLTADGYLSDVAVAFIGAARTAIVNEATISVKFKQIGASPGDVTFLIAAADGNDAIEAELQASPNLLSANSWGGSFNSEILNCTNAADGVINAIAVTVTASRLDIAANNFEAEDGSLDSSDRPPGNPFVAALLADADGVNAYQSITLYDPLPSTAGLSELSETGVTNTAPTNLHADFWGVGFTDTTDTSGTVSAAEIPGGVGPDPDGMLVCSFTADDAEGNPLSRRGSIVDDEGGKFAIVLGDSGNSDSLMIIAMLEPSIYSPVVRITDPGGLYVEQEFTITVTA